MSTYFMSPLLKINYDTQGSIKMINIKTQDTQGFIKITLSINKIIKSLSRLVTFKVILNSSLTLLGGNYEETSKLSALW